MAGKILPSHKDTDYKSFYGSFMDLYVYFMLYFVFVFYLT